MKTFNKITLAILFVLFFFNLIKAQECTSYFPMKEGTVLEYQSFNGKDKFEGTNTSKIIKKEVTGTGTIVKVQATSADDKGKYLGLSEYTVKCENGVFTIDMGKFIDPAMLEGYKNMDIKMTSENLEMPGIMKAGDLLKGGSVNVKISNSNMTLMTMDIVIKNRKVEAIENITTPAGTFECYKISADVETKMMFKVESKVVEWYAKNTGSVRSENYDKNGKLNSYSVLNKLIP